MTHITKSRVSSFILKIIVFIVSLHQSNLAFSQKSEIGNWFIYVGNQAINKRFNWWNEVQYRNYNFAGDLQQLLIRTGIGYNLSNNNNNLLLGYAFIHSQNYLLNETEKVGNDEHRLFQQLITRQNFGRTFIQHRYRIEERFLSNDFQIRFRYLLGLNIPLNKKTLDKHAVYVSLYNECFLKLQSTAFDRNRLYGALGYMLNKSLKLELGFMAQTLQNTNRNQFQIVMFNNLPFRNK